MGGSEIYQHKYIPRVLRIFISCLTKEPRINNFIPCVSLVEPRLHMIYSEFPLPDGNRPIYTGSTPRYCIRNPMSQDYDLLLNA